MEYEGAVADLLRQAEEIMGHGVAESSKAVYGSAMRTYERVMGQLRVEAHPIDVNKMKIFLMEMKGRNRQYNTLAHYIEGFSYYFRMNDLPMLTQDVGFKIFKSGLRRVMTANGSCPKAKEPFKIEFFESIVKCRSMEDRDNRRFMFIMCTCFHAFLRIGELMQLKRKDIVVNEGDDRIDVHIRRSKTDQFGIGDVTYIFKTDDVSCPWAYRDVLDSMREDERIVGGESEYTLRRELARLLTEIGVTEPERYSFHSFRRGGAHLASIHGVNDCVIKAHGRWLSSAYIRYVHVEKRRAGMEIAAALVSQGAG